MSTFPTLPLRSLPFLPLELGLDFWFPIENRETAIGTTTTTATVISLLRTPMGALRLGFPIENRETAIGTTTTTATVISLLRTPMGALRLNFPCCNSNDATPPSEIIIRDKRREFVSGFTGSAGLALITRNEALLWTDGRYFLQAALELSDQWKLMRMGGDPVVDVWMVDQSPCVAVVAVASNVFGSWVSVPYDGLGACAVLPQA
ncbi:hypothetical protein TEA_000241 [Camellia sinensis var. sinensis]|uniref:Creatinase N-terminal domain-containing protein n=1 Tax=Camellia sinensis var. sinensis TaxID=542762 RepID=A0A4S4DS41_CAMSN|nr:hypothetical protein TEA_000241 [Camellia sinensis var. sinensis]